MWLSRIAWFLTGVGLTIFVILILTILLALATVPLTLFEQWAEA